MDFLSAEMEALNKAQGKIQKSRCSTTDSIRKAPVTLKTELKKQLLYTPETIRIKWQNTHSVATAKGENTVLIC